MKLKTSKKMAEEFTRNSVFAITSRASYDWTDDVSSICKEFRYFCNWMNGYAESELFDDYKKLRDIAIKNRLAVFDITNNETPIQSVLFEGIDYTCIEYGSTFWTRKFPAEHIRQLCDNHFIYSSDFEINTHYPTRQI